MSLAGKTMVFMTMVFMTVVFMTMVLLCQTLGWELGTQGEEGEASPTLPKSPVTFTYNLGVIMWMLRQAPKADRHRGDFWPVELHKGSVGLQERPAPHPALDSASLPVNGGGAFVSTSPLLLLGFWTGLTQRASVYPLPFGKVIALSASVPMLVRPGC